MAPTLLALCRPRSGSQSHPSLPPLCHLRLLQVVLPHSAYGSGEGDLPTNGGGGLTPIQLQERQQLAALRRLSATMQGNDGGGLIGDGLCSLSDLGGGMGFGIGGCSGSGGFNASGDLNQSASFGTGALDAAGRLFGSGGSGGQLPLSPSAAMHPHGLASPRASGFLPPMLSLDQPLQQPPLPLLPPLQHKGQQLSEQPKQAPRAPSTNAAAEAGSELPAPADDSASPSRQSRQQQGQQTLRTGWTGATGTLPDPAAVAALAAGQKAATGGGFRAGSLESSRSLRASLPRPSPAASGGRQRRASRTATPPADSQDAAPSEGREPKPLTAKGTKGNKVRKGLRTASARDVMVGWYRVAASVLMLRPRSNLCCHPQFVPTFTAHVAYTPAPCQSYVPAVRRHFEQIRVAHPTLSDAQAFVLAAHAYQARSLSMHVCLSVATSTAPCNARMHASPSFPCATRHVAMLCAALRPLLIPSCSPQIAPEAGRRRSLNKRELASLAVDCGLVAEADTVEGAVVATAVAQALAPPQQASAATGSGASGAAAPSSDGGGGKNSPVMALAPAPAPAPAPATAPAPQTRDGPAAGLMASLQGRLPAAGAAAANGGGQGMPPRGLATKVARTASSISPGAGRQ